MAEDCPQEKDTPQYFLLTLLDIDYERALLTTVGGQEVAVFFQERPTTYVAKDLGKWARRNLGLKGRTDPGVFTQIIWKDRILGINHPLVTLIGTHQQNGGAETVACTFCQNPLRDATRGPAHGPPGPFPYCHYCKDEPSWHHGWCCPQNVMSAMYRGPTHADRSSLLTHGIESMRGQ